jgi:glycolate oxidase iron-sulfur subunit
MNSRSLPSENPPAFQGIDIPNYDFIVNCMHCGLCLPHCPTYALTGLEKSSPRGRIRLIKSVADGELAITPGFVDEMAFCLDCQACETACPAGVKYGSLVEAARAQIFQQGYESLFSTLTKQFLLGWVLAKQSRTRILVRVLNIYQKFGFQWFFQHTGLIKIFSAKLHELQFLAPTVSERPSAEMYPERVEPYGEIRYRVGFLTGCLMDLTFADVNVDTIELLRHYGCEVVIPPQQTCCGSLQGHNGDRATARELALLNIKAFDAENLDAIIMNTAGCGAFMKEYGHLLEDVPAVSAQARRFSEKVKDLSEFLSTIGPPPGIKSGRFYSGKRVTYHDACHLVHTQKIGRQPRELIQSVPGITYVELAEASWCCGSAGIYNIVRYDDSMKLLERKLNHIEDADADLLITSNHGCLAQLRYGLSKNEHHVELLHLATFLRRAIET